MKPYAQMTPAERLAYRVQQNKEIEIRVDRKKQQRTRKSISKATLNRALLNDLAETRFL